MTTNQEPTHLSEDELVAGALDNASADALDHLAVCEACRDELESYRSILRGVRTVFSSPAPHVHVFHCQHGRMAENHVCTVIHPVTGHCLNIACQNGWLNGSLSKGPDGAEQEQEMAVRLFSRQGLVDNVPVNQDGTFLVRCLNSNERHSLTIVLGNEGAALQLLPSTE